ncbi:MAG: hypothetical protein RIS70_4206 [Planctomycetota bacterium]
MSTEPMKKRAMMAEFFERTLKEQGFHPHFDEDGDIVFKTEGKNVLLYVDPDDDEFFRLTAPAFFPIENETDRRLAERAAHHVTRDVKVVKVFPVRDHMWASVELLCSPIQAVQDVLSRCVDVLHHGVRQFAMEYHRLAEKHEEEIDFGE